MGKSNLGPDVGVLSNSKNWKSITPSSFRSPFYVQADLGKKQLVH